MADISDIYLTAPDLSPTNILGYTVGVRPYRREGVRLAAEIRDRQLIIHNYGYGGAGLTLCWGGAQSVISLLQEAQQTHRKFAHINVIAILGAGVIGLSTAYELLKLGYRVAIYAADFPPYITSNVAAGILSPSMVSLDPTPQQQALLETLLQVSIKRYLDNMDALKPEFAGLQLFDDYTVEIPSKIAPRYRKFNVIHADQERVRIHFDNGVIKLATQKKELGLDGKLFMANLYKQIQDKGTVFYRHYFSNRKEISALAESIIINCTSMGSRKLFDDQSFIPIRGHMIYLKLQPGVDYAFYQNVPEDPNFWIKLYPWHDRAVLGGVFENHQEENKVDEHIIEQLYKYARKCFEIGP